MAERDPGAFTADPAAYGTDIYAWTQAQAALLRERRKLAILGLRDEESRLVPANLPLTFDQAVADDWFPSS